MCNRYRMSERQYELAVRYGVQAPYPPDESFPPAEIFPRRNAWVVREDNGARVLDVMRWGVPTQVPGKKPGTMLNRDVTNVRNLSSPFWRGMLSKPESRCLVPVSDFCEWAGEKGAMIPHWFSVPSSPIFSFAGVWRPSSAGVTFAFLTCGYDGDPSTHIVGAIHAKAMPVILLPEDEQRWLDGTPAAEMATCFPSQMMRVA